MEDELRYFLEVLTAPSVCFRPRVFLDGNQWCALYGDDLQVGVAGFGDTPAAAVGAFDAAWYRARPPAVNKVAYTTKGDA